MELVRSSSIFRLVTEPSFALSVFRIVPSGDVTEADLNALNQSFYSKISARHDIWLTQTKINDVFCIRFAVGAARTTKDHIDKAWKLLNEEAEITLTAWSGK